MPQDDLERPAIARDDPLERSLGRTDRTAPARPPACAAAAAPHIIGVSVSDTTAEMRIVTLERDRELAEQTPDDVAHEQQRNQHGDQRHRQRDDREADLLRRPSARPRSGDSPSSM